MPLASTPLRYRPQTDTFEGPDQREVRSTLKRLYWDRYYKRLVAVPRTDCQGVVEVCSAPPVPPQVLNRYDGATTFVDAQGVFRFRVTVAFRVEEIDVTSPEEVAHLLPLLPRS